MGEVDIDFCTVMQVQAWLKGKSVHRPNSHERSGALNGEAGIGTPTCTVCFVAYGLYGETGIGTPATICVVPQVGTVCNCR